MKDRTQLILEHLPYIKRIVQRIAAHLPHSVETDDLINAGVIGLMSAIERFDPTKNCAFLTYATFMIKGAVAGELRSRDHLSRSVRQKIRQMEKTYLRLEQELGRTVADEEAAEALGIDLQSLYDTKRMAAFSFISLEDLGLSSSAQREQIIGLLLDSPTPDACQLTCLKQVNAAIAQTLSTLTQSQQLVISLYYRDELTMKEIGKVLDISESRVSQIHAHALLRLRTRLLKKNILPDALT